jgi:alkaline phosphatase
MIKHKGAYVDGFLLVVPTKKLKAYKNLARIGKKIWCKYGALDYKECIGEDLNTKWGIPFSKIVKLKAGEKVVFSYIVYKSRTHRDRVNAKVMKDPSMNDPKYKDKPMPFDLKRMAYGGFKVLVG